MRCYFLSSSSQDHSKTVLNNDIFCKPPPCLVWHWSSCSSSITTRYKLPAALHTSSVWKHPSQIHFLLLLLHFWCSRVFTLCRRLTRFLLQERLEIVCTFRQKYCVLLPQTQLEQILTLSQVIWLCCHDHSLKNVPTSRQNLCWEMSWLWVNGIWFVATDTASKSSKVESKISDLVATNSAGGCLDFE